MSVLKALHLSHLDKVDLMIKVKAVQAVMAEIQGDEVEKVELQAVVQIGDDVVGQVQPPHGLKRLGGQEPVPRRPVRSHLTVVDDAVPGQVEVGELFAGGKGVPAHAADEVLLELQDPQLGEVLEDSVPQLGDLVPEETEGAQPAQPGEGALGDGLDLVGGQVDALDLRRFLDKNHSCK